MIQISNLISLTRLVLTLPMAVALIDNQFTTSILIGIFAYITDILDGYLARRLKQVSEFGKIIDPLADKIFLGTVVIILAIQTHLPLWFVLVVILRDLLILAGGLYAKKKIDFVIPANYLGKFTATINSIAVLVAILNLSNILIYVLILATAMMLFSIIVYFIRMIKFIRGKRQNNSGKQLL
jgi:CDP-diacylglycerol--glycerol-3-phosphate 3-phosphatidyltransferase